MLTRASAALWRQLRYVWPMGLALATAAPVPVSAQVIPWPMKPFDSAQPLGNSYGEYQWYGGAPYFHPGIDIMGQPGDSVFAVRPGYVKAVLTTAADLHWRVAVGDSAAPVACDGYLYAHLDLNTIQVAPGDTVIQGQYLGSLVEWPVVEFHHLHFVQIRSTGYPWSPDWQFIHNPLDYLVDVTDTTAPEFVPLDNDELVAFYTNQTSAYFAPGDPLSGAVDFLVSVRDKVGHPYWWVAPYQLSYRFRNDSVSYPARISVQFRDTLWWTEHVDLIYRNDGFYGSRGDYNAREFYMICTNTDGDEYIEGTDADSAWFTGDYPNGSYWLQVSAIDRFGNRADESLQVVLHNLFTVSGTVLLADQPPSHAGTVVALPELGLADTTDASGAYAIPGVGPGHYLLRVERSFYDTIATVEYLRLRDANRSFVLQPIAGLRGDLDHDADVDASDVLLLVNYIFKSGPAPEPRYVGDANGIPPITSGDVIFLINYIFKGGPPPPPL